MRNTALNLYKTPFADRNKNIPTDFYILSIRNVCKISQMQYT